MDQVDASTMAASARQKFQGVWSQLRSMAKEHQEGSFESATTTSDNDDDDEENDNGVLEGMMTRMFGSCTTNSPFRSSQQQPNLVPASSTRSSSLKEPRRRDVRLTLLQNRKERSSHPSRRSSPRPAVSLNSTGLSKPFPVSSPTKAQLTSTTPALIQEIPACMGRVDQAGTFDDGISAISAYTLDEMAKVEERQQNALMQVGSDLTENTAQPPQAALFYDKQHTVPEEGELVTRGRSNTTAVSKVTRSSKSSKSTFESNWRRDEVLYWNKQVAQEEDANIMPRDLRDRSRSRSGELHKHTLGTVATASTGLESPFSTHHPHDTLALEPSDFFPSCEVLDANRQVVQGSLYDDPDRIVTDQEIIYMAMDCGEIGEI